MAGRPGAAAPAHRPDRQHPPCGACASTRLYSPDSTRGRLGLLGLRGFEMPPHPQMALVQALLVRSLVAMFWEHPIDPSSAPLVRWGTRLHEDHLLPHGAAADIAAVTADLAAAGIDLDPAWFAPFTEFRFPRIGAAEVSGGIGLERARAWSRGTSSVKRRPAPAPPGTSTPRSSASR
ncbi:transglutaminase family protein [Nocardioides convexus]|uniref:transglutaminase family protein n=1 Tax=Nocardioides convexus TaxID=2712224 RepID=UPI00241829D4|nr:transglutaminase family protein [Nocardioides convexus]